eukprot:jgi/Chlat1/2578/Chrsp175S00147
MLDAAATSTNYAQELAAAYEAVQRACQICLSVQADMSAAGKLEKADNTEVTVADFSIQAQVSLELQKHFPDIPLVAEEDSGELRRPECSSLLQTIVTTVQKHLPDDLGDVQEEAILSAIDRGGSKPTQSFDRFWVLDPVDGTRGFLRGGKSQYVVGLALVENGKVVVGAMGCPQIWYPAEDSPVSAVDADLQVVGSSADVHVKRGVIMCAAKGSGAWVKPLFQDASSANATERALVNSHLADEASAAATRPFCVQLGPASVASSQQLVGGTICISDHEKWEDLCFTRTIMQRSNAADRPHYLPLCCGSLCKYAAVVTGAATVFVQHPLQDNRALKSWDHAAGIIIVEEAGGSVTDFFGEPLVLTGRLFAPGGGGVVVSNGAVHDEALKTLATCDFQAGAPPPKS